MCILCGNLNHLTNYLTEDVTEDVMNMLFFTTELYCCPRVRKIPKQFTQITELHCPNTKITEISKEFTQLECLNCSNTNITEIPKEFTQLIVLKCYDTEIKEIPKEFTQLEYLNCSFTNITEIPKEFTQLTYLNCSNTNITEIPAQIASQLTGLDCSNTNITEIPSQLTELYCSNCPNLVKVPENFKKKYINEYNFIRVPTLSRLLFNKYKRNNYSEKIRLELEIKFNEVYYAPTGQGALELFEKYTLKN